MFRRVFAVAAAACAALPSAVFAQSASCVNPQPIGLGDTSFSNLVGYDEQAVRSDAGFGEDVIYRTGWFAFTPDVTARYMFGLCGANGDTMMAIGTTCPGVGSPFQSLAYNDDSCAVAGSTTSFLASFIDATNGGATGTFAGFPLTQDLVAGQTYYIIAGSYGATTSITGTLTIGGPDQPTGNPADLNNDGVVNAADLSILLGNWGGSGTGDINGDGTVGAADLANLLGSWG